MPHFAFARDGGSLETATERCVGVGACRKTVSGVMCPSYRATGDEKHSTRGRAHLLWEMLAGSLHAEGYQSEVVHEALDLCLSCKACKTECPVQVDMAAYKAEFLAQHYKGRMHPLQHYVFGFADKLARFGSIAPGITNGILTGALTSPIIKRIAGVAPERALPRLAGRCIYQELRAVQRAIGSKSRYAVHSSNCVPMAGYVEQLLPSANAGCGRDRAHRSRFHGRRYRKITSVADGLSTTLAFSVRQRRISTMC